MSDYHFIISMYIYQETDNPHKTKSYGRSALGMNMKNHWCEYVTRPDDSDAIVLVQLYSALFRKDKPKP